MSGHYKTYDPDQLFLLPPSLKEWLPEGHLAYFVSDVVDDLDLGEIEKTYSAKLQGQPPYHPALMVKLLFYAYCRGIPSSRKIEKENYEDIAFGILAAGYHPDHDTIADFRKNHLRALKGLFLQILTLCKEAKLVKLGHVALDGTKMKANASKHKAMSCGRMHEKEQELEREVSELLRKAESVDAEEDATVRACAAMNFPRSCSSEKRDWRRSDKPRKPLKSGSLKRPNPHRKITAEAQRSDQFHRS